MEAGYGSIAAEIERALTVGSRSGQQAHLRRAALLLAQLAGSAAFDLARDRAMRHALAAAAKLLPVVGEPLADLVTRGGKRR